MTPSATRSAAQRRAIAHARAERAERLGALVADVDAAVAAVGWCQARPCVVAVLGPHVPISGPRGRWRRLLRVRSGRRLLAMLDELPAQGRLALGSAGLAPVTHPAPSLVTTTPEAPT